MRRLGFDLILLGAPAAGKDTQASLLLKQYRLHPVESGKYWRQMASQKSATGALLRRTFSKGHATPVKLMKQFLVKQLRDAPKNVDLLFIGNPRLKPEAQLLKKLLEARRRDFFVVSIDLPVKEIKERSIKRMRDDQDWNFIHNRIKMYRLQVSKTLDYFNKLNKLKVINGNRTISEVAEQIEDTINDYQRRTAIRDSKAKRTNLSRNPKPGRQ